MPKCSMGVKNFSYFFIGGRAKLQQKILPAPDFFSVFANSFKVEPVVKTSSINRILHAFGNSALILNAFLIFRRRSSLFSVLCGSPCRLKTAWRGSSVQP